MISALHTHEVVKELKAAGFTDEQAEAVTRAVRRAQDIDLSNLVTKARSENRIGRAANRTDQMGRRYCLRADCCNCCAC